MTCLSRTLRTSDLECERKTPVANENECVIFYLLPIQEGMCCSYGAGQM